MDNVKVGSIAVLRKIKVVMCEIVSCWVSFSHFRLVADDLPKTKASVIDNLRMRLNILHTAPLNQNSCQNEHRKTFFLSVIFPRVHTGGEEIPSLGYVFTMEV